MWTCPKCGRTFARNGQDHYCGKPPETIDEYILNQPEKAQPLLKEINETIRGSDPGYHGKNILEYAHILEKAQSDPVCCI